MTAAALFAAMPAPAQELTTQPTPFTALLDFAAWNPQTAATQALPIWLESVQIVPADTHAPLAMGLPEPYAEPHTLIRIRLRSMPSLGNQILLRLFFDDRSAARPTVSAWSDTGGCLSSSEPLGAGLDLPASETLVVAVDGVNYLEIDVPGDGKNLRKAFLSPIKKSTVSCALDFAPSSAQSDPVIDPFGKAASQTPSDNDLYLYGRVRATLGADIVKLEPAGAQPPPGDRSSISYEFHLEAAPLLCFVSLEILNADPLIPLQASVNGQPVGQVTPQYPDLADPGYNTGSVQSTGTMHFQYSGWLRAQVIIPSTALKSGANTLTLQLPASSGPAAIRTVELELKHHWQNPDPRLAP